MVIFGKFRQKRPPACQKSSLSLSSDIPNSRINCSHLRPAPSLFRSGLLFGKPGFSTVFWMCASVNYPHHTHARAGYPQIRNLSNNFAGEHNLPGRISSSALPCLRPVPLLENRQENKRPGAVCGERPSCPKGIGKDPVFGSCKGKAAVPRTGAGSPSISTATFFF